MGRYTQTYTDAERAANRAQQVARQQAWRIRAMRALRQMVFDYLCEGQCASCGTSVTVSTSDVDHIDPLTKTFHFSQEAALFKQANVIFREADKCQILCKTCHVDKSRHDIPVVRASHAL